VKKYGVLFHKIPIRIFERPEVEWESNKSGQRDVDIGHRLTHLIDEDGEILRKMPKTAG